MLVPPDFVAFLRLSLARGCSPVIEMTSSGWLAPAEQHRLTMERLKSITVRPLKATISLGPSNILISRASAGENYLVGRAMTVAPRQSIIISNTLVDVQISNDKVTPILDPTLMSLQPDGKWSSKHRLTLRSPILLSRFYHSRHWA